jgi:hypothetical protein
VVGGNRSEPRTDQGFNASKLKPPTAARRPEPGVVDPAQNSMWPEHSGLETACRPSRGDRRYDLA